MLNANRASSQSVVHLPALSVSFTFIPTNHTIRMLPVVGDAGAVAITGRTKRGASCFLSSKTSSAVEGGDFEDTMQARSTGSERRLGCIAHNSGTFSIDFLPGVSLVLLMRATRMVLIRPTANA